MTDNLKKSVERNLSNAPLNQELSPGSTERRWIPPGGLKGHREKIHRESKVADDYKNLPFTFSKPYKAKGRSAYVECDNCNGIIQATSVTVGVICPHCGKFSSVSKL